MLKSRVEVDEISECSYPEIGDVSVALNAARITKKLLTFTRTHQDVPCNRRESLGAFILFLSATVVNEFNSDVARG